MQLLITISGAEQLSRNLADAAIQISNLSPVIDKALHIVEKRSDDIFSSEGANLEKAPKWKGLAASTLKARANRWGYYKNGGGSGKILDWTGKLKNSRTKKVEKDYGMFGFTADYAKYHQEGYGNRPPKRAIIDLDNKTIELIEKEFQKACEKALQARPF